MQARIVVATGLLWGLAGALLGGCGEAGREPTLRITPSSASGPLAITGPTQFTAETSDSDAAVTWELSGAGTLSGMAGFHVVYGPPPGTATATLTARAGGLVATVQLASSPPSTNITIPNLMAEVKVNYDAQDIPHIQCAQAIDCFAVQGYLQARDRLFPMDFLRRVARGKVAELIGIDGLARDVQLRTLFTTRAGKRLEVELAAALDPALKPLLLAFVGGINAYLAELRGPNSRGLPGEYQQLPFPITPAEIPDWTLEDTLAIGRLQQFQLSESIEDDTSFGAFAAAHSSGPRRDLGKIDAWIRTAAPVGEQAHTVSPTASQTAATTRTRKPGVDLTRWATLLTRTAADAAALREFLRPAGAAVGSNNWVISASKAIGGKAMVANDPHLTLQYPPLFYLSEMTSSNPADNLKLAGGTFPGVAGALVGRGANVAWGVTVVGYDVTDVYLEQFLPPADCPQAAIPCVEFKGEKVSTIPVSEVFRVRTGPGSSLVNARELPIPDQNKPPEFLLVVPHHGPIIRLASDRRSGVSVRWTGHEANTQDTKAFHGLNRAANVDEAIEALRHFATGAQNFVLADDKGDIAYFPRALVPVRNFANIRATPPWFPLPGDGSAEWGDGTSDCAAPGGVPRSCWLPDDALPQGKNPAKGYYFTANADPTSPSVSDDNDPLSHLPYLSHWWSDSTGFRAARIEEMIEDAIAKNGGVSLADMEAIQADVVSRPGRQFAANIAALPTAGNPPELAAAKAVLAQWATNGFDCPTGLVGTNPASSPASTDTKVLQSSAGCFLFHAFLRTLIMNVFTDDLAAIGQGVHPVAAIKAILHMVPRDPAVAEVPAATTFCNDVNAAGDRVATHTCREQYAIALIAAYRKISAAHGTDPNNWLWGKVHTIQPVSLLALVTTNFSPGPYARPGGAFTVDVGNPSQTVNNLEFGYTSGGNVRHISVMDPAKPVIRMQLPGPQRDGPTGIAGPDLLGKWVTNTYFDFVYGAQIDTAAVATEIYRSR